MNSILEFLRDLKLLVDNLFSANETDKQNKNLSLLNERHSALLASNIITQNEKDYILSQYHPLLEVNQFNVPVLNTMYERLRQRCDLYYKKNYQLEDILISDLNYSILVRDVSLFFKINYLEECIVTTGYYSGIRYGPHSQLLFNIPTSFKTKTINVIYLLDTGSLINTLSNPVIKAFNIENALESGTFKVLIGGITTEVLSNQSDDRLEGINLIGDRFLRDAGAKLELDYNEDPVKCSLWLQNWKK